MSALTNTLHPASHFDRGLVYDCARMLFVACVLQDSALIATGSADRNVKIWGLDFGDCHRSMFAHDDR